MDEQKGNNHLLIKLLNTPSSSVIAMAIVGVVGFSTGFISYQADEEQTVMAQVLDTTLPSMSGKSFKESKYDNPLLKESNEAEDSTALENLGKDESKQRYSSLQEKNSPKSDQGFSSNENLAIDRLATSQSGLNNRQQIPAHFNQKMAAQDQVNRQKIEAITSPAALSAAELAERRSREESLERAAKMEQLAVSQLESMQSQKTGNALPTSVENISAGAESLPTAYSATATRPTTVTLANLDEYVDVPRGTRPINAFYGLKGERKAPEMVAAKPVPNAIEAVIHGDADNVTIVTGSTIKLRLLQDIQVGKLLMPMHSILSGECVISGERVQILITTIRLQSSIIPIKLRVYDVDGHPGIYVPNLAVKNQISQTSSQAVTGGSIQMPYMIPSGGSIGEMVVGQTASQGVNMAINGVRSLTSKKMAMVKVTIRPNHRVYLKQD